MILRKPAAPPPHHPPRFRVLALLHPEPPWVVQRFCNALTPSTGTNRSTPFMEFQVLESIRSLATTTCPEKYFFTNGASPFVS
jgi:hypothetical protein